MKFELWSIMHILYMLSPFVIFAILYFCIKNRSDKIKSTVGIIIGTLSVLVLIVRNIDIYVRCGWNLEVIPLQVCHIGSLVAGFALIFKKKWLFATSFCFNMIPAFLAMVFADSLANYDTLLKIRPQTYIWGHIFIVVCALYALLIHRPKFCKKDLYCSLTFVTVMAITAVFCNSLFRSLLSWEPNYFYLFDYKGTPLKFLYTVFPSSVYGWFEINWIYTLSLIAVFICVYIVLYIFAKKFSKK